MKTIISGRTIHWPIIAALALLGVGVAWVFWPIIAAMSERWSNDPRYAHGYLVPMFSLALLWMRWPKISAPDLRPSILGLAFIALGVVILLAGGYFRQETIEGLALLAYLAGVAMIVGGWPALRWAWPSILFLFFMIPLPWKVENAVGPPLQLLATKASTFALQTFGFMAFAEGNVIQLNDGGSESWKPAVVSAC